MTNIKEDSGLLIPNQKIDNVIRDYYSNDVKKTNGQPYSPKEVQTKIDQIVRVIHYLKTLPVKTVSIDKVEADDIIAYLGTALPKSSKDKIFIVSSDRDFIQLVNENIIKRKIQNIHRRTQNIYKEIKNIYKRNRCINRKWKTSSKVSCIFRTVKGNQRVRTINKGEKEEAFEDQKWIEDYVAKNWMKDSQNNKKWCQ